MLLKNQLIEDFKNASQKNNILLKEVIVFKWVHRFGIDSLNDLLINSTVLEKNKHKEENQEQISLIDEVQEENQEQISLIDEVQEENQEQISLIDEMQEENQEQISLTDEVQGENQEQIKLESLKTSVNLEEITLLANRVENLSDDDIFCKNTNKTKKNTDNQKLPLPHINNLRKWINNDKKAS